jgi:hypothetical protein
MKPPQIVRLRSTVWSGGNGVGVVTFELLGVSFPLEFAERSADASGMEILGHVRNGVIVLDKGVTLPEGTTVTVSYGVRVWRKPGKRKRVKPPLVESKHPGSLRLTGERIAQILDDEDLASFRKSLK